MVRPLRRLAAAVVFPHELAHAVPAAAAGLSITVTPLPEWEGDVEPLWQFDAELDDDSPLWLIRLVAVAPLVVFLAVAAGLRVGGVISGVVALPVAVLCALWGSLSAGDLGVALSPAEARSQGQFLATVDRRTRLVADVLAIATTAGVALLLLW